MLREALRDKSYIHAHIIKTAILSKLTNTARRQPSQREVVAKLNREGILTVNCKPWYLVTYQRFLKKVFFLDTPPGIIIIQGIEATLAQLSTQLAQVAELPTQVAELLTTLGNLPTALAACYSSLLGFIHAVEKRYCLDGISIVTSLKSIFNVNKESSCQEA